MTSINIFASNISTTLNIPIFRYLAFFICHLFIDGQFRTVDFLFDPSVFDDRLTIEIESICSHSIPWKISNISQSSSIQSNSNERSDYILQLILFDPTHLEQQIDQFKCYFTYYRIFVFSLNDETEVNEQKSVFQYLNSISNNITLIVYYDTNNGSVYVKYGASSKGEDQSVILTVNRDSDLNDVNLFDETFDKYEQKRTVAINVVCFYHALALDPQAHTGHKANIVHYYQTHLPYSYINGTYIDKDEPNDTPINMKVKYHGDAYEVYVSGFEQISDDHILLQGDHSYALHLDTFLLSENTSNENMVCKLYPFHSVALKTIFVYGTDFRRETGFDVVSGSILLVCGLILLLISLAAITLYILRRIFQPPGDNLLVTFTDCLIPFIGGGSLRMHERWEKWFFSILLFAAFFIVSMVSGNILDAFVRLHSEKVNTFKELAKINSSIYIDRSLEMYSENITSSLRGKMGPYINYKNGIHFEKLANIESSFAFIYENERWIDVYGHLKSHDRDYDTLAESLGDVRLQYYLESDHYVPIRMIEKINKISSLMMEYGKYEYFVSMLEFKQNLLLRGSDVDEGHDFNVEDDFIRPFTLEQLQRPFEFILCLYAFSVLLFFAQIFVYKWIMWRNIRIIPLIPLRRRPNLPRIRATEAPAVRHSAPF